MEQHKHLQKNTLEGLRPYPLEGRKTLTIKNRQEIYQRLTKSQRALIEKHKKYKMGSFFLEKQYLKAEEWDFHTLNVDENYNQKLKKYHLYCQCGKPVKYQFVLKSKVTNEKIQLGITHFTDHLGVTPAVASEIKKGLNQVDLALDEILWLKDRRYLFPQDLWQKYLSALHKNEQLVHPIPVNLALTQRVWAFLEVDMPIFVADYLAIVQDVRAIEKACQKGTKKQTRQKFEAFLSHFTQQLEGTPVTKKEYLPETKALFARFNQLEEEKKSRVWSEFQQLMTQNYQE